MKLLDQEIKDNTDLVQVLKTQGMVVDGQIGKDITAALLETFPLAKSEQGGVSLESQQLDYVAKVGAWQALTHQGLINNTTPSGLFYVVNQDDAGAKDVVRFCTAVGEMDKTQTDNSFLCVKGHAESGQNPNPFANALFESAVENGIRVGSRLEDYFTSGV